MRKKLMGILLILCIVLNMLVVLPKAAYAAHLNNPTPKDGWDPAAIEPSAPTKWYIVIACILY